MSPESLDSDLDPADPRSWMALRTAAVDGLLRGDKAPATRWLRYVERHRSRAVAERSRDDLRAAVEWQRAKEAEEYEKRLRRQQSARKAPRPSPFAKAA